jgi:capsule polysaccharide export protein KpsE/RkpR
MKQITGACSKRGLAMQRPPLLHDLVFAGRKTEMKRRLETATEAPPESVHPEGAESTPELPNVPELLNADDVGLRAPNYGSKLPLPEWDAVRTQPRGLLQLRLLWAKRQLMLNWAMAGCCGAILLALVIPKQYVSAAKLMPPEAQSASKLAVQELTGGFGSIAGGLLGGTSSGALLVAMMRSRTVEDRIIERFNLKKVYRIALQQKVRARLEVKTTISLEPKTGIVVLSVTDSDPQRAAAMALAYVQELEVLMAQLNISSAHRERVFLQDRLQVIKVDMETAEKELSEFASKNGAMDITEQGRVMIESAAKIQAELIVAESQVAEVREIYSESNPRVRSLQARVSELVNQKKQLLGTYSGKSFADGAASISSFPTLRQLPILGVPYESKFRKLKMEEAVYETLRTEFESAKVQEARENPYVEVLDLPEVPKRKSFPPRLLIVAAGTASAVILSGVWILGVARWRETDPRHPGSARPGDFWNCAMANCLGGDEAR